MPADVVVVGAGPTGMTAAVALAQHGVRVTVLERWQEVFALPRAIAMDDEVQRILARLGLADVLDATTRPAHGMQLMDRRHRVLARFDRSGISEVTGFWRARMFDQPTLERSLRSRATELGGLITLRTGVEVTAVEQTATATEVRLTELATGKSDHLSAAYVLACDGANSAIRSAIGSSMADRHFEQRWLVVDIDSDVDLDQWPGVHQRCDTHRAATFMQGHASSRYRWELQLLDDEDVARDFATIEQLLPFIAAWTGTATAEQLTVVRSTEYTFRAQLADRWRDRRVFLLGDAAHLTPPFIGQGLCAGVRDAANLAWKVAGVVQGALPEDVLDSYQAERRPHARSMIDLARLTGGVMTGGGRSGDLLRRALVPWMQRVPGLRRRLLDSASPALTTNAWVIGGGRAHLAGTLVPNVCTPGGRLDDHIVDRWVLLTSTAPSPSDRALCEDRGVLVLDDLPAVRDWLTDAGVPAAVARPDGVVLAAGSPSELCGLLSGLIAPATTVVAP